MVFVGHAGFPTGAGELWRELPHHQDVQLRLWLVPAEDVPTERGAQIDWLFDWWRTIDAWVAEQT